MANEGFAPFDLPQLYNAIRLFREGENVDEHFVLDVVLAPGFTVSLQFNLPMDRVEIQRYMVEWGDPVVEVSVAVGTPDAFACYLHYVPPTPTVFEFSRHPEKRSMIIASLTNTDLFNTAEYHMNMFPVLCSFTDWQKWKTKLLKRAEEWLEK